MRSIPSIFGRGWLVVVFLFSFLPLAFAFASSIIRERERERERERDFADHCMLCDFLFFVSFFDHNEICSLW